LRRYLRAKDKGGLTVPWVYARRQIARAWGCPPWAVDEAPIDEVQLELALARIEAQAEG
jgi:hypothetical protein